MSGSVNKVILLGRLGADPETRNLGDGRIVTNLRIATSERWKDKNSGERKEKTEWHRVVIFNQGLAKIADQWLVKGSDVYIEGSLQTRKWQDQSGNDKYSTEIVLSPFNGTLTLIGGNKSNNGNGAKKSSQQQEQGGFGDQSSTDDEIPF